MAKITVDVKINKSLANEIKRINNPTTMVALHNTLAKMCDPYVPMQEGVLAQTAMVSADSVRYIQPYARYQYYGEVYGPNIPIKENGEIVGWFSPPGQPKHPTGRPINYSKEKHPLATSFWDKAMLRDHGDEFNKEVEEILTRRLMEVDKYGR